MESDANYDIGAVSLSGELANLQFRKKTKKKDQKVTRTQDIKTLNVKILTRAWVVIWELMWPDKLSQPVIIAQSLFEALPLFLKQRSR